MKLNSLILPILQGFHESTYSSNVNYVLLLFFRKKVTKKLGRKEARLTALSHELPPAGRHQPHRATTAFSSSPPSHCAKFTFSTLIQQNDKQKF